MGVVLPALYVSVRFWAEPGGMVSKADERGFGVFSVPHVTVKLYADGEICVGPIMSIDPSVRVAVTITENAMIVTESFERHYFAHSI